MSNIPEFDNVVAKFGEIYSKNAWGGSGGGSRPNVTNGYREFLAALLSKLKIQTVVDLGCGDWQFSRLINWQNVDYTGIDVDEALIQRNSEEFGAPNIRFRKTDVFLGPPSADLLICKDVMQHWPNDMIAAFLPFLSRYKFALITNCADPVARQNTAIEIGRFRPLNLIADPFLLPATKVFEFRGPSWRKESVLWSRDFSSLAALVRAGFAN